MSVQANELVGDTESTVSLHTKVVLIFYPGPSSNDDPCENLHSQFLCYARVCVDSRIPQWKHMFRYIFRFSLPLPVK